VPLSSAERERYARHLALGEVNRSGQEKLKAARVVVVGAGGLGSPAALYLAAAGVGTLGLVDCDRVELSNLQRQILFDGASVSRRKTDAAQQRLAALNPEIRIVAHDTELCAANVRELFEPYDIVLDGSDRLGTRYLVNDACVVWRKSLVSAAIHRFEGQAMTYVPGAGPCYRCLFPDSAGNEIANCAEAGVLGVLPGVLGAIQATEVIKLILGIGAPLIGRLLTYDALELKFREFAFARRPDCAVCGEQPSIRIPSEPPRARTTPAVAEAGRLRRMRPAELQALLAVPGAVQLIDVREPQEFRAGHIGGALHIPLAELASRGHEIPSAATVVFICRSGGRSLRACAVAASLGVSEPANLEGGMLAWVDEIDPMRAVL
jgi:sulfur-carrier protein adenylyltransferase/sulfurtransferase